MNDPVMWIIVGIGFVVWLVSTIYKSAESAKAAPGAARPQRPRQATSEIDKFLEEINRRRAMQQQQQNVRQEAILAEPYIEEAPKPPPLIQDKIVIEKPKRIPTAQPVNIPILRKSPAEARRSKPKPSRSRQEAAYQARIIQPVVEVNYPAMPVQALSPLTEAPTTAMRASRRENESITAELLSLLKSANGIKAAYLVHEVLGQPRCKKQFQPRFGLPR